MKRRSQVPLDPGLSPEHPVGVETGGQIHSALRLPAVAVLSILDSVALARIAVNRSGEHIRVVPVALEHVVLCGEAGRLKTSGSPRARIGCVRVGDHPEGRPRPIALRPLQAGLEIALAKHVSGGEGCDGDVARVALRAPRDDVENPVPDVLTVRWRGRIPPLAVVPDRPIQEVEVIPENLVITLACNGSRRGQRAWRRTRRAIERRVDAPMQTVLDRRSCC